MEKMWRLLIVLCCMGFYSCSSGDDDDAENYDDPNKDNPNITPHPATFGEAQKHLVSIIEPNTLKDYCTSFYYSNGVIESITDDNCSYELHFDESQRTCKGTHKFREWKNFSSSLSYNNMGYISHIGTSKAPNDADSDLGGVFYTYDNKGHLQKLTHKSSNGEFTSSCMFTWVNDTITQIVMTKYDITESESRKEISEFEYNKKYPNQYQQYPFSILLLTDYQEVYNSLFCIGYMGKGPAYFPEKITHSETFIDDDHYDKRYVIYKYSCNYIVNNDGSLDQVIRKQVYYKHYNISKQVTLNEDNNIITTTWNYKYE